MGKIGFFLSEFPLSIEKYITEEIEFLSSIGVQPFILSHGMSRIKKYYHAEIEPVLSVWQSLKSLNGIVEESDFLKALKRSAQLFEDESVFAMATKASMIIKTKKIEILNAYSPKSYHVAMISSWITKIPFGISIFTPEELGKVKDIETVLKEAYFIVVYSDKILKDLKNMGFFDTDKVLRIFPGVGYKEFLPKEEVEKICLVDEGEKLIDRVMRVFPPERIVFIKNGKIITMRGEFESIEKENLSKFIGNLGLILFSKIPSFDNLFSLENRLLRKALYLGVPILIFGNLNKEGNNIEKLLKNFLYPEEQLEIILTKLMKDEKFRKRLISEGKEIASALFDLERNATLLKGLFERILIESSETNSMDRWLKRGRKLPRKN